MLPLHNVVSEVVKNAIPALEVGLAKTDRPVIYKKIHPEAMEQIHDAYYSMNLTLKEHPQDHDTVVMEFALKLAGAAIKFVSDLGDPRILRRLAPPDALTIAPEWDDEEVPFDEREVVPWEPLLERRHKEEAARAAAGGTADPVLRTPPKKRSHKKKKPAILEPAVPMTMTVPETEDRPCVQEAPGAQKIFEGCELPSEEEKGQEEPSPAQQTATELPTADTVIAEPVSVGLEVMNDPQAQLTISGEEPWSFTITG